jgi:hypothetical protein
MTEYSFEINGRTFYQTPLKARPALRGLSLVSDLLPALASGGLGIGQRITHVEELVDIFLPGAKVDWDATGKGGPGTKVPLVTFLDLVFQHRTSDLVAWLLEVVIFQYQDFLAENGLALLEAKVANALGSLTGSTGASGG